MTAQEAQTIAEINAEAVRTSGKRINSAALQSAETDRGTLAQSVEYFRTNKDASVTASALLHGFRNDISIDDYNGINTYSFITAFEGLTPAESNGNSIPLLDAEGNVKAALNIEALEDADGNTSFENKIAITPYGTDGEYLVTVTLDSSFLSAASTAYPTRATTSYTMYVGRLNGYKYRSYFQLLSLPVCALTRIALPAPICGYMSVRSTLRALLCSRRYRRIHGRILLLHGIISREHRRRITECPRRRA